MAGLLLTIPYVDVAVVNLEFAGLPKIRPKSFLVVLAVCLKISRLFVGTMGWYVLHKYESLFLFSLSLTWIWIPRVSQMSKNFDKQFDSCSS